MFDEYFELLADAFDRDAAVGHIAKIYSTDRFFDFARFKQTADYVFGSLTEAGLAAEKIPLRADGKTRYGDWVPPRAWDVREAVLSLLADDGSVERELHRYTETPCMLAMLSAGTPGGAVCAEYVDVDGAAHGFIPDVRGKIILTGKKPADLVKAALDGGALGIISDHFPTLGRSRESKEIMGDHCRWDNNFIQPSNDTGLFAFCVSPNSGRLLRSRLAGGKSARVRAEADVRFYDGTVFTVTGVIPGETREEVLLAAHLYEPGANDNASGCGMLLELARSINHLIISGKIKKPRRALRFVFGWEVLGLTGYWMRHRREVSDTLCGLNPDMVGAAAAERASFTLWMNPPSNRSFIDLLIPRVIDEYRGYAGEAFEYEVKGFGIGDNALADPSADVPTVCMIMHPALSYHSSMDDMSMVDPDIVRRNAIVAGAAVLFCAEPDGDRADFLRYLAADDHKRLGGGGPVREYIGEYGKQSINNSINKYLYGPGAELCKKNPAAFDAAEFVDVIYDEIPVRLTDGTITLSGVYPPGEPPEVDPFYNYAANCPLFWCDGKRTTSEVAVIAGTELGADDLNEYQDKVVRFFKVLEGLGHIKFI